YRPQLDRCRWKGCRDLAQQRTQTPLELHLCLRVSLHMARTRHAKMSAEPSHIDPPQLTADRSSQALRHPGGDGAPIPAVRLAPHATRRVVLRSTAVGVAAPAAGLEHPLAQQRWSGARSDRSKRLSIQ